MEVLPSGPIPCDLLPRVSVVGTSCSGKTTFSQAVAARLGIPHVELDALYWGPGWSPADPEGFRTRVEAETARPAWVIEGNYTRVRDLVWGRATLLVFLDLPFGLVFRRALTRTIRRLRTGEICCGRNRETLRDALSYDGIPIWVLRTWPRNRIRYRRILPRQGVPYVTLRSVLETARFLDALPTGVQE